MQTTRIKLADLVPNTGQVPGLPSNPRQWTKSDIDRIAASLKETPELFEARPIIAVPHDGKFVILGGNLRYEGARKNKDKDAPVCVIPEDTPVEKMKEIVIKDNGSFGAWDYDALANEWDDLALGDWGVPAWNTEEDLPPIDDKVEEELDDKYSDNIGKVLYEPKDTSHRISDLYDMPGDLDEVIAGVENEELRKMLEIRKDWFCNFNFAKIADYYAYQATPAEQRAFERLGLVLLDRDQLIENGFASIIKDFEDDSNH